MIFLQEKMKFKLNSPLEQVENDEVVDGLPFSMIFDL